MEFDIYSVMEELPRRVFTSESDFQLALAMQIERMYEGVEVRCEFPPIYESCIESRDGETIKGRIHIDILVVFSGKSIPIELKYRTRELYIKNDEYEFELKNQNAHDEGTYGFWRDVKRIDEFIDKGKMNCDKGYTVFLTNDLWYESPNYSRCIRDYEEFNINDIGLSDRRGCVSNRMYALHNVPKIEKSEWKEFLRLDDIKNNSEFKYYIAEITRQEA